MYTVKVTVFVRLLSAAPLIFLIYCEHALNSFQMVRKMVTSTVCVSRPYLKISSLKLRQSPLLSQIEIVRARFGFQFPFVEM